MEAATVFGDRGDGDQGSSGLADRRAVKVKVIV